MNRASRTLTAAALGALVLAGCSAQPAERPDPAGGIVQEAQTGTEWADVGDLTALGNLPKAYGETASTGVDSANPILEFVIDQPREAVCDTSFGDTPENGRFVELPMTVQTFDDPEGMLFVMAPSAHSFEFVDPTGNSTPMVGTSSAAGACGFDSPTEMRPNRTYEYPVVVDVPEGPGSLVLNLGGAGGWEYPLD